MRLLLKRTKSVILLSATFCILIGCEIAVETNCLNHYCPNGVTIYSECKRGGKSWFEDSSGNKYDTEAEACK